MYQALAMNDQRQIAVQHEAAAQEIDPFIELLRSIQSLSLIHISHRAGNARGRPDEHAVRH